MDQVLLSLAKRDLTGKAVKRLREDGLVPAVIHNHGKESLHVQGNYMEVSKAYQRAGRHSPLNLNADGRNFTVLIREVDVDPKRHQIRHVVFNAVKANEKVSTEVPVRISYADGEESTPAERAGLVVLNQLESVEVEALPRDLPEFLEFDGEKLVAASDSVTVADLIVPKGVTVKTDPNQSLATVFEPSALQAANDAAGGTAEEEIAAEEVTEETEGTGEAEASAGAGEQKS